MPDYDPDAELDGKYVAAFVESAGEVSPMFEQEVRSIFAEYVDVIDADAWYRIGDVEHAFRDILDQVGDAPMVEGGIRAAHRHEYPEWVERVRDASDVLNDLHKEGHRNSELEYPAGRYTIEWRSEDCFRGGITTGYPYTPPVIKGVYKGMVQNLTGKIPSAKAVERRSGEASAWLFTWGE